MCEDDGDFYSLLRVRQEDRLFNSTKIFQIPKLFLLFKSKIAKQKAKTNKQTQKIQTPQNEQKGKERSVEETVFFNNLNQNKSTGNSK